MTKLLDKERDVETGVPSRIEEVEPKTARTVGMVGACFLLFGVGMWLWNAYRTTAETPPPFRPFLVYTWCVLGVGSLLFHAVRDRAVNVQRAYGFLGRLVLLLGACFALIGVGSAWVGLTSAIIVASVFGLLVLIATAGPFVRDELSCDCPVEPPPPESLLPRLGYLAKKGVGKVIGFFPRWGEGLATNSLIQQVTIVGAIGVAAFVATVGFLVNAYPSLNFPLYGYVGLILGLLFVLPSTASDPSSSWRDSALYTVGVIGLVLAAAGFSPVFTDWLGLQETMLPHGLVFGLLGFAYLWAFIGVKGSDSEVGYNAAVLLATAGVMVFALTVLRAFVPALSFEPPSYRVPAAFFLLLVSGLYALLGMMHASDSRLLIMTRRELAAFFYSPIAYIVIGGMAILAWWMFLDFVELLSPAAALQRQIVIQEPIIRSYFWSLVPVFCLMFFVPMITMRLLSEEQRTGTLEVLLTAPVGEGLIVLSKFFAALIFFMVAWLTWAVGPVALRVIGQESFDYRPILSFYLGVAFITSGFLSMGLFCSSLTRNQIIAFLLGAVGILLAMVPWFMLTSAPADASETKLEVLRQISFLNQLFEFVHGKVFVKFIVFHLSLTVLWLFLTMKVLEARKWR